GAHRRLDDQAGAEERTHGVVARRWASVAGGEPNQAGAGVPPATRRDARRRGAGRDGPRDPQHPVRRYRRAELELRGRGARRARALDAAPRAEVARAGAVSASDPSRRWQAPRRNRHRRNLGRAHGAAHAQLRRGERARPGRASAVQLAVSLQTRAWLFLAVVALAAAACGAYFARGVPLQTNLLAM